MTPTRRTKIVQNFPFPFGEIGISHTSVRSKDWSLAHAIYGAEVEKIQVIDVNDDDDSSMQNRRGNDGTKSGTVNDGNGSG